ncbi:MAG: thiamine pyrophosphate-binding protein [Candidatus Solibacter sp.]|nr:thiamine pyrophosphate-binding protein [Candidatus Solibacter sp.]
MNPEKPAAPAVDRRNFLKRATSAGTAAFVAAAQQSTADAAPQTSAPAAAVEVLTTDRPGADFMVDAIKSLGFEYIAANPGSSFRGLHESMINYGGNLNPQFITCCHEESAVAMAHGYAKIEGKPMCVFIHATVGLMHASMAIYNAYVDRVPIYMLLGNMMNASTRRPALDFVHSAQDIAAMVREYVKWDDMPMSLESFAESAVRGYRIAMTPPTMPVLLVADINLQEDPVPAGANLRIPKLTLPHPPQGDSGAVQEAAKLLFECEHPVIVVDRSARTQAGLDHLVELAELLQAPVLDQLGRMNFPSRHALNQYDRSRAVLAEADVILGLELLDFWGVVNSFRDQLQRSSTPLVKPEAKLISITVSDLYMKSNYQDLHRFREVDVDIAADAEATVPLLIEAIKRMMTPDRRRAFDARGAKLAATRQQLLEKARDDASYGWDASPISVARLCAEVWDAIQHEDWSFVSYSKYLSRWPQRLWDFTKYHQFIGGSGGVGIGYNAPASVGAALANRKHGRLTVNIQGDGDLMYAPGVLWTSAHHKIPLLSIVHNNRAYHAEVMQAQLMTNRHNRGVDRAQTLTSLTNPNIDFSGLAKSLGVYGEGPITDPKDLGAAIRRAIAVVKRGEPALVDVVSQGR